MKITLCSVAVYIILGFAALSTFSQERTGPLPTPAAKSQQTEKGSVRVMNGTLRVEFPQVANWEKGDLVTYPQPELGSSVSYESDGGAVVTAYIFNGGLRSIPNMLNGPVKLEMDRARAEIASMAELGYYSDLKELAGGKKTLAEKDGRIAVLHSAYSLTVRQRPMISEIYVFPFRNHFVKVRVSTPQASPADAKIQLETLLKELENLFADNLDRNNAA